MPDWTELLTEEERARLRIYERVLESGFRDGIGFLKYDVMPLFQALAASRALVEEQRGYIRTRAEIHKTGEAAMTEDWRQANCQGCQAEAILALTEADMLKRLEEK